MAAVFAAAMLKRDAARQPVALFSLSDLGTGLETKLANKLVTESGH
jgi:hypothetical protein